MTHSRALGRAAPTKGNRPVHGFRKHPRHLRDDEGMTLTELLIASTLLVVLLTVVMTSMSLVSRVTDNVSSQYEENDQALPALAPMQSLIRAEVEPGPTTLIGAPTPGFGVDKPSASLPTPDAISGIGNFSLTFYTNIGSAYHNVTGAGTTAGPAMIVAGEYDSSGNAVNPNLPNPSQCNTSTPCSFQVREYLPHVHNDSGSSSCPFTTSVAPPPTPDPTPPAPCQYTSTYTLVTNVLDVINDPSQQSGGAPTQPIFTYDILDTTVDAAFELTPSEVQTGTIQLSAARGYPSPTTASLTSCAAPISTYTTCPADAIQSVGIDLMIGVKGSGDNGNVENQTIVYRYPESPESSTYPYQYSGTVG